ncbi:unnamed protein product [Bursaphelenchus xylophilus]|uniref:(pine wood nematode) hypothetical protein n=1 Tax=Bursaphelenchus xylophilus TaxID=6326 RepID=A0A1I7S487_BURXY|nr:unnamed protein product [Bursaphelenchus xylophilus]CAG9116837.1 unnamed protein product [Bursaphelenchus xylophilus]
MPLINDLNVDQMKVPLGFIKIPQLLLAIIAFSSRSGWEFSASFTCKDNTSYQFTARSFSITDQDYGPNFKTCAGASLGLVTFDHSTASSFFGFVSMVSIIFVLIMLFLYLFRWGAYAGDERIPKVDTVVTMALAVAWFLAAWSWWSATHSLGNITSPENLTEQFEKKKFCDFDDIKDCKLRTHQATASLTVSVLAGFASLILFASNIWYAYKETVWFRDRNTPAPPQQGP